MKMEYTKTPKRMRDNVENGSRSSTQNKFTAYLIVAINNTKARFLAKRASRWEQETPVYEYEEMKGYEFEDEFVRYMNEQIVELYKDIHRMQELLKLMDGSSLMKAVLKLSEREQSIVFARVFGQRSFKEIGAAFGMKEKQAEAIYYYSIRKVRREMEDR